MEKAYSLKKEGPEGVDFGYIDQDGVSFDSPANWLFTGILGGCGCGSSDEIADKAVAVLEFFSREIGSRDWSFIDGENEILAHWLDSKGLLEHGSSIGGSWLSKEGEQVLKSLKEHPL